MPCDPLSWLVIGLLGAAAGSAVGSGSGGGGGTSYYQDDDDDSDCGCEWSETGTHYPCSSHS